MKAVQQTADSLGLLLKSYVEVTKPATVLLLVFTSLSLMILAGTVVSAPAGLLAKALVAITLASAGANSMSCYIDRDIDAIMERTKKRPLPSGRINPPENAFYLGLMLVAASVAIALTINFLSAICLLLGIADYLLVYSSWLKRRSALNIVLGGFSGGFPALFGWVAITGSVEALPVLLALLVVTWIPNHIWSLAIFYKEDYRRAGIPMLPAVTDIRKVTRCIFSCNLLFSFLSFLAYFSGKLGTTYLVFAAVASGLSIIAGTYLLLKPTPRVAKTVFKISSPNLFILFLGVIMSALL